MDCKPVLCMTTATDTAPNSLTRLVTYRNYAQAFVDQGAIVLCVSDTDPDSARQLCEICDGLFLTGGADVSPSLYHTELQPYCGITDPWRDRVESVYSKAFLQAGKPIFGICRGFQMLNVILGGSLYQDIPSEMGLQHAYNSIHSVTLSGGSVLDALFGPCIRVNSFHHQAVADPGFGMVITAWSEGGVAEAMEHERLPILGVQFHPERMAYTRRRPDCDGGEAIWEYFLERCSEYN